MCILNMTWTLWKVMSCKCCGLLIKPSKISRAREGGNIIAEWDCFFQNLQMLKPLGCWWLLPSRTLFQGQSHSVDKILDCIKLVLRGGSHIILCVNGGFLWNTISHPTLTIAQLSWNPPKTKLDFPQHTHLSFLKAKPTFLDQLLRWLDKW